jgi:hypothetical protein
MVGKIKEKFLSTDEKEVNTETIKGDISLYWALGITTFIFALVRILELIEPTFRFAIQFISQIISVFIGKLSGQKLLLNPTASGFYISLLFIIFGLIAFAITNNRKWINVILYITSIFIINVIYIASVHPFANLLQTLLTNIPIFPTDLLILLLLLDGIPLYFYIKNKNFIVLKYTLKPEFNPAFIVILLFFIIGVGLHFYPNISTVKENKNILLYNKGYCTWDKPVHGRYGLRSSGMFGMLPLYLSSIGYTTRLDSSFNSKNLDSTTIVVIINLDKKVPENEKQELKKFINNGGSLLVLGDHTDLGGIMRPLNDIIDYTGIKFRFDCGHYLNKDWQSSMYEYSSYHPMYHDINDEKDIGISVGASLEFTPVWLNAVSPLLNAKYGFSDWGNPRNEKNAYLGDRRYNPGELLGDITLITEAEYGKGKVIVFGDTSPFQNGALCYSFQFVKNIFDYLNSDKILNGSVIRIFSSSFILIGLIFLMVNRKSLLDSALILWLSISIILIFILIPLLFGRRETTYKANIPIAYIDDSHLNRFTQYGDEGIWSLTYNLMRNGYLPFVNHVETWHRHVSTMPKIQIFISPVKKLNQTEIQSLDEYLQNGGTVIWSVGYQDKEGSQNILDKYGFDLDNIPLGPIQKSETICMTDISIHPKFHEAWPIINVGRNDISPNNTICTGYNYPVIISKAIGKGKFILISDHGFLLSENIESENKYFEENILFLKNILTK